jgi:transketolase
MSSIDFAALTTLARTIRGLSIDAIEAANSGHPGLPLGCAEIGAYLYGHLLDYTPAHPEWIARDRFILSAGHGSMLLYAALHLSGYKLSLDEIKRFRQMGAPTAGHPEFHEIPGIETTTGPLGQGIATGIGMALGQKILAAQNDMGALLNSKVYILAGDGCMMEGISSEAASFAGHLSLDNVVLIYDANDICLDGPISECMSENVADRFKAYNWDVLTVDGNNLEALHTTLAPLKTTQSKPTLVIAKTVIGKGSPTYQGTSEVHGKALGKDEIKKTKEALGIPLEPLFDVPDSVKAYCDAHKAQLSQKYTAWTTQFEAWKTQNPEKAAALNTRLKLDLGSDFSEWISQTQLPGGVATRQSSGQLLQLLSEKLPFVIGGSADLSGSDNTMMKGKGIIQAGHFTAQNIKYGVREFAMGAIASGLALHGGFIPFCGTFLTFSDYMRNAIRLAALMKLRVVYQFTHDSIFLGEDGPTHQPVEHLAALRAIPGLTVIRPADATEVKGAWQFALTHQGPTALILSRQALPALESSRTDGVSRGAYVLQREAQPHIDYALIATGSEVSLALQVAKLLHEKGKTTRVISMPSWEVFDAQDAHYQGHVLGGDIGKFVSIEAQSSMGWHRYIGRDGIAISVDQFGLSAPARDLAQHFGFTPAQIVQKLEESQR